MSQICQARGTPLASTPPVTATARPAPADFDRDAVALDLDAMLQGVAADPITLQFWFKQNAEDDNFQERMVAGFMARYPGIIVKPTLYADYDRLYQRVLGAIQSGETPDLVALFESQAAEYYEAGALVELDRYIESPTHGIDRAEFVRPFLDSTVFPQYGRKALTFPFLKSALVMYTNLDTLREFGFAAPAATWDQLIEHCRALRARSRPCYAFDFNPSIFDGIVFSLGGQLINETGDESRFDERPVREALQLYDTLARGGGYAQPPSGAEPDFESRRALYLLGSSSRIRRFGRVFGTPRRWAVTLPPQATARPATALFGTNIAIMRKPGGQALPREAERRQAAWLFIKYATSTEVGGDPSILAENGFFPVRTTAAGSLAPYIAANPRYGEALAIAQYAHPEPGGIGWQDVREIIRDATVDIVNRRQTPAEAGRRMLDQANRILKRQ